MRSWTRTAAACGLLGLIGATHAPAQEVVFLVRHAEKVDESKDATLSEAGLARARSLASHLAAAGVDAIYVTQYQRTQQTAAPLAARIEVPPTILDAAASDELVRKLRARHARHVVLVVGHSDSVPEIIARLGCREKVEIGGTEYDNLFAVVPRRGQRPLLLRLKY